MARRKRMVAGVLALIALTLSIVEGVSASYCAPMCVADESGAMSEMPEMSSGMAMDCAGATDSELGSDSNDSPDCPLAGFLAPGCTAAAALPGIAEAAAPAVAPLSTPHNRVFDSLDTLLARSLFHPPRV